MFSRGRMRTSNDPELLPRFPVTRQIFLSLVSISFSLRIWFRSVLLRRDVHRYSRRSDYTTFTVPTYLVRTASAPSYAVQCRESRTWQSPFDTYGLLLPSCFSRTLQEIPNGRVKLEKNVRSKSHEQCRDRALGLLIITTVIIGLFGIYSRGFKSTSTNGLSLRNYLGATKLRSLVIVIVYHLSKLCILRQ